MQVSDFFPKAMFKGQTVFVTGGGSGINLGIATAFAELGADVAICGRTQEKLDAAAEGLRRFGGKVLPVQADVRSPEAMTAAFARTRAELGPINVLICGAAGNFLVPAERLSPNGFKTVVDIDLIGSFNASRLAFDQLKETRGSLIFISAAMAHIPHAFQAHVGAAKAGIDMLMKNLALEWGPYGIRSNSVLPGPIENTEGMSRLSTKEGLAKVIANVPLKRMGTLDDVANAVLFLCSPMATYITGTLLSVDGGKSLPGSAHFNANAADFLAQEAGNR